MQHPAKSLEKSRRGSDQALAILSPTLELQHLWFRLAGARSIQSVALVPAERDLSTLAVAQGLAQVAASLPDSRVLVVNASLRDCLPPRGPAAPPLVLEDFGLTSSDGPVDNCELVDFGKLPIDDAERALLLAPQLLSYLASRGKQYSVALFAVDSILHQTRAIPLVRSLDAAALCISLGHTTYAAARQLIDIVGRERVLGAVTIS